MKKVNAKHILLTVKYDKETLTGYFMNNTLVRWKINQKKKSRKRNQGNICAFIEGNKTNIIFCGKEMKKYKNAICTP